MKKALLLLPVVASMLMSLVGCGDSSKISVTTTIVDAMPTITIETTSSVVISSTDVSTTTSKLTTKTTKDRATTTATTTSSRPATTTSAPTTTTSTSSTTKATAPTQMSKTTTTTAPTTESISTTNNTIGTKRISSTMMVVDEEYQIAPGTATGKLFSVAIPETIEYWISDWYTFEMVNKNQEWISVHTGLAHQSYTPTLEIIAIPNESVTDFKNYWEKPRENLSLADVDERDCYALETVLTTDTHTVFCIYAKKDEYWTLQEDEEKSDETAKLLDARKEILKTLQWNG